MRFATHVQLHALDDEAVDTRIPERKVVHMRGSSLAGVITTRLEPRADERGVLREIFRASWPTDCAPVQWNIVSSEAKVLRGFHVHFRHSDYLLCVTGRFFLGLRDLREDSPTCDRVETYWLDAAHPMAVTIPPGIAHGFCFVEPAIFCYGVSHYWDHQDELACAWNDPAIDIEWPIVGPLLSPRDANAGTLAEMKRAYAHRRQSELT